MSVEEKADVDTRIPACLAGAALVLYIVALFLPLHLRGQGIFENAFPAEFGTRLTIGFLIRDFSVPLVIGVGLLLLFRRRFDRAAGVFVGAGLFAALEGLAQPFYVLFRARPLILLAIQFLVGAFLMLAAYSAVPRRTAVLPPPP